MNVRYNLHKYWILYFGAANQTECFHMLKVSCLQKRSLSSTISSPPKLFNHNRQQTSAAQFVIQQKSIKWSHEKKENSVFAACCGVPHGSKFLECFKWSVQEGRVIFKKKRRKDGAWDDESVVSKKKMKMFSHCLANTPKAINTKKTEVTVVLYKG